MRSEQEIRQKLEQLNSEWTKHSLFVNRRTINPQIKILEWVLGVENTIEVDG
jgi:virulence-associated protein VapD